MDEKIKLFQEISERYKKDGKIYPHDFEILEQIYAEWHQSKAEIFDKKSKTFKPVFEGKHCNMALCKFIKRVLPGRYQHTGLRYFCEKYGEFLETDGSDGRPKRLRCAGCMEGRI